MKTPKGWMKCLNPDCSLCYALTEDSTYDIGRWITRGKIKVEKNIKNGDFQVFFFFFI
jgi:hypothetical protein